ncbi:NAD kinase [uncultured Candidatus Thioglobus sp.]|nr:NAD kinase [uncultured Candidatus Thioglobus sp.]
MFKHIVLITNSKSAKVLSTLEQLTIYLQNIKKTISFYAFDNNTGDNISITSNDQKSATHHDLAIAIGGDGTMLKAAQLACLYNIPLLGINRGKLGFLADIPANSMEQHLRQIFAGHFTRDERFLLSTEVFRKNVSIFQGNALNDVILQRWNIARLVEFKTYVDNNFVHQQRSDGLIISSPTGSTAYALSGGGPILYPSLSALALIPICPHSLSNRPIIIDASSKIEIIVGTRKHDQARLTCDGDIKLELAPKDRVCISKKDSKICFIHPADHNHFNLLRAKLNWGKKNC